MKRTQVKCSDLCLRKSSNVNGRRSQELMAAQSAGMDTNTLFNILTIIFPIKTFREQLKVLQDSSKTLFFHIRIR